MKKLLIFSILIVCISACGPTSTITRGEQYNKMYDEKPVTLLIMPPINNSTNVEAKDLLYTSISRPLAEAGYYVISPLLAMDILKAESAYDSELFVNASLDTFLKYFGADAVVFSEINSWEKQGMGIQTNLHYFIKSAHTGEIIFDRSCNLYLDLSVNSGSGGALGLLVDLVASAITTAVTDHIVAARSANYYVFRDIPRGKYSPEHLQDMETLAESQNVNVRVK